MEGDETRTGVRAMWLWVLLGLMLIPVVGGGAWALATGGRRNHPQKILARVGGVWYDGGKK